MLDHTRSLIQAYLDALPPQKGSELKSLHAYMVATFPSEKLWFLDGKDANGKVVANPNIGYGTALLKYANGSQREFYRVGISANTQGISVYFMGLNDKNVLADSFGAIIGKAKVTGYCIQFKSIVDIDLEVLQRAIHWALHMVNANPSDGDGAQG